jgi:hypothetical protein
MRWCLLATIALAGAGCGTTTTVGPAAATPAQPRFVEEASSQTSVEATDRGPDQPGVVVVATSPTDVRLRPDATYTVVPLGPVGQPTVTNRKAWVTQGMWIGAGIGVLYGAVSGNERDNELRATPGSCDTGGCGSHVFLDSAVLGAIGLGLGAAVGAIIGRIDSP